MIPTPCAVSLHSERQADLFRSAHLPAAILIVVFVHLFQQVIEE